MVQVQSITRHARSLSAVIASSTAFAALTTNADAQPCAPAWVDGYNVPGFSGPNNSSPPILALMEWATDAGLLLVAGGNFNAAGSAVGASAIAAWNGQRWNNLGGGVRDTLVSPPDPGLVRALAVFNAGAGPELYASGWFRYCDEAPTRHIAKWTGSAWQPLTPQFDYALWSAADLPSMQVFDDASGAGPALYVAGEFYSINGVPSRGVVKWTGSQWLPVSDTLPIPYSTNTSDYGGVRELAVFDDGSGSGTALYAAAYADTESSSDWSRIYRLGPNGWQPVAGAPSATTADVLRIQAVDSGAARGLYAHRINTTTFQRYDGANWSPMPPGFSARAPRAACVTTGPDPLLAIVRDSTDLAQSQLELWDGSAWTPLGPPFPRDWFAQAVHVARDGGGFRATMAVLGHPDAGNSSVLRLTPTGWSPLVEPGLGVHHPPSLEAFDEGQGKRIFATRALGSGETHAVSRLDGDHWTNLSQPAPPSLDTIGKVVALRALPTPEGPRLHAIGALDFSDLPAAPRIASAAWDGEQWIPSGDLLGGHEARDGAAIDFGAGPELFLVGGFGQIDSAPAQYVARRLPSGWATVGAPPNEPPLAIVATSEPGGAEPGVYVGGPFTFIGAMQAFGLARWNGVAWSSFPGFSGSVRTLAVGRLDSVPILYILGSHLRFGIPSLGHIARYDGAAWRPMGIVPSPDAEAMVTHGAGPNQFLLVAARSIYLGPFNLGSLAIFDGVRWSGLIADIDGTVSSILVDDSDPSGRVSLTLGGHFTRVGDIASTNIARIDLCSLACPADTNSDRVIDMADLNNMLDQYAQPSPGYVLPADLNADGSVNFLDLNILLSNFGEAC